MGYTDAWNRIIPVTPSGTREYLELARMYLYDGTTHKPTTMGWMAFEMLRTPPPLSRHLLTLEERRPASSAKVTSPRTADRSCTTTPARM